MSLAEWTSLFTYLFRFWKIIIVISSIPVGLVNRASTSIQLPNHQYQLSIKSSRDLSSPCYPSPLVLVSSPCHQGWTCDYSVLRFSFSTSVAGMHGSLALENDVQHWLIALVWLIDGLMVQDFLWSVLRSSHSTCYSYAPACSVAYLCGDMPLMFHF